MPPDLLHHHLEWRATTYLICFDIVELHLPERVMRQFGFRQLIPPEVDTGDRLHRTDRRGKGEVNWANQHAPYIHMWNERLQQVVDGDMMVGHMDYNDPYLIWYRMITRLYINPAWTPPSTHYQPSYDIITGYVSRIQL